MRTLGQILEEAERRTGLGISRAAAACGANRSTYRAWKGGSQKPTSVDHIARIVKFTGEDRVVILELSGLSEESIAMMLDLPLSDVRARNSNSLPVIAQREFALASGY